MRILVVAPQPFFSPRGTPFSVYYRTLVTAELGAEIDVLTYGQGEDVDIPGVRLVRIPRLRPLGEVRVGPSALKLLLDGLLLVWTVAALVRKRYDVVHAHEESAFFCRFLKPLFGFKLVYDMHSSLPQQLHNFEFSSSAALHRIFEQLEAATLKHADAVITICPDLASYALDRVPDGSRHFLIENSIFEPVRLTRRGSADSEDHPGPRPPTDRSIIAYAGTFEPYQGLELLLEAFAAVRARRADVFLLLIGGTPSQVEHYRGMAHDLGIGSDCLFTGRLSHTRARCLTAGAAVLVSPRIRGTNTPLKIYEQLASGIPLVATRIRAHTQVLTDDICFLVEPVPERLAEDGLLPALQDPARRASVVAAAQARYHAEYSRPAYQAKMRRLLDLLA